jgi:hypothetical protein
MQGRSRKLATAAVTIALAIACRSEVILAGNRITLKKNTGNSIIMDLSNTDAIAGVQFSVSARGGIALGEFESSDRLKAAGIAVYQALNGDSTLNVVLLAPVRSSLPNGDGPIGSFSYLRAKRVCDDSVRVVFQKVLICDASAQALEVTTANLSWSSSTDQINLPMTIASLEQNFPNPFNPSTTIAYRLAYASHVRLAVYDIAGRMVSLLVDQELPPGHHTVQWNPQSGGTSQLASGMYFARLNVGSEVAVMKMILTK